MLFKPDLLEDQEDEGGQQRDARPPTSSLLHPLKAWWKENKEGLKTGSRCSATKQSVTLCAVVVPPPQSCVSPHLPALKLHPAYLLLSLSLIIIMIILILLLLWLGLLSLRAISRFYFHGLKRWFAELGACVDNRQ